MDTALIIPGLIAIVVIATVLRAAKIVPEYQRLVIFRLGRALEVAKGPGLVLLIPWVDRPVTADLREFFIEVPAQSAITKDNAPVSIDFLIYLRVMEPRPSVIAVQDFRGAAEGIAKTTLRAVVGDISLDDVLSKREEMNLQLRMKLDEVTERWGVKVTAVEVKEIQPPRDIQDAMSRQMSAERNRRAVVLEADGQRAAAIAVAEGQKQAAILTAEGLRQATILEAEGTRQALILQAEGLAGALGQIDAAANRVSVNTMGLQYLDAFKTLFKFEIPCIIVTNDNVLDREILDSAAEHRIPIFQTHFETTKFVYFISDFLDDQFSPQKVVHSSFVDVYGIGLLITGRSGIGKSEVALDLVERGHRLVADDVVMITRKGEGILIGAGTELVKHVMEIRGLGLIDIRSMFGIRAIRFQKRVEVVVELQEWKKEEEYTRTGLDSEVTKILDVELPLVKLPIFPGKNITVIAEVIALNYLLKHYGYDAAKEFTKRLETVINEKNKALGERAINYFEHDFE